MSPLPPEASSPMLAAAREATATQGLGTIPVGLGDALQTIGALLLVLALIAALAWLARRLVTRRSVGPGTIRLLGGLSLGPRERVVLMQTGEWRVLVGVTPGSIRALHVFPAPVEAALQGEGADANRESGRAEVFAAVLGRMDSARPDKLRGRSSDADGVGEG